MGKNKKNRNKLTEEQISIKKDLEKVRLEKIETFEKELNSTQGHYLNSMMKKVEDKATAKYLRVFPSCKKCYQRGYIGFDLKTLSVVPCSCIFEEVD